MRSLRLIAAALTTSLVLAGGANAATIVIQNIDGAGEGFNDATPAAPVGGNPGTTRGAQRLNAFTYAANLWAARLSSPVTITVSAKMDPLPCDASSAVLGSAGTVTIHRDFTNAPVAATWYSQALANSRRGIDLSPANADISATFNSNLNGTAGCLGGTKWYYGYNQSPPPGDIDFVSVVLHEIGHGLGFQTYVNLATGAKNGGFNDTYMLKLDRLSGMPPGYPAMTDAQRVAASTSDNNLRWIGTNVTNYAPSIPVSGGLSGIHVRVHAPNPQEPGSSVSHFSYQVSPNQLMEPRYTGPNHNIDLSLELMKDIGWIVIPTCTPGVTTVSDTDTLTINQTASSWNIKVEVTNTGSFPATGVNASMFGGPAWLSIPDGVGTYPNLNAGAAAFNNDTYTLDLTDWPGGPFQVSLQVFWEDNCGGPHNQTLAVNLLPSQVTPVPGGRTYANRLDANVPNPFNPSTTIQYQIGESGPASIRVYDVNGSLVRTLVSRSHNVGAYETRWDGRNDHGSVAASGVYFYRLETTRFTQTRRMVLLK